MCFCFHLNICKCLSEDANNHKCATNKQTWQPEAELETLHIVLVLFPQDQRFSITRFNKSRRVIYKYVSQIRHKLVKVVLHQSSWVIEVSMLVWSLKACHETSSQVTETNICLQFQRFCVVGQTGSITNANDKKEAALNQFC